MLGVWNVTGPFPLSLWTLRLYMFEALLFVTWNVVVHEGITVALAFVLASAFLGGVLARRDAGIYVVGAAWLARIEYYCCGVDMAASSYSFIIVAANG